MLAAGPHRRVSTGFFLRQRFVHQASVAAHVTGGARDPVLLENFFHSLQKVMDHRYQSGVQKSSRTQLLIAFRIENRSFPKSPDSQNICG